MISAAERYPKKGVEVHGRRIAYVEAGTGDPIVLQHGNPTSSYLWRNIIPHLEGLGRCIAMDLVGMGDSEKLPDSGPASYTFLGFDWANRHRDAVKGIAYMEAILQPLTWAQWPEASRKLFQAFRSPAGEQMVLENDIFVERVLPGSVLRDLTEEEMDVYRRPFREPGEARRPTLTWPRQIPIEGDPADVCEIVQAYADWLAGSDVPKLFVNAEPGAILVGEQRELCRGWPNQREVTVKGRHFVQEDAPDEIGQAIAGWYAGL
jgi:haloalkane dehalogenase